LVLAIVSIILNSLAQITIKSLASLSIASPLHLLRQWQLYGTGVLYGASIITWFLALKGLPLSIAYPMQALGYVLVTGLAYFAFHESIGLGQVIGLTLIVSGVTILAWGIGE
jgi:multidrug transporter EmrE-like cation transporter